MCHMTNNTATEIDPSEWKAVLGEKAPDFRLPSDLGGEVKLSDFLGKKIVLYFYPKDNTSGCSLEAMDFEAALKTFQGADFVILGISRDSLKSHANFREKKSLTFPLLSDTDSKVCTEYGVLKMKSMYGRKYLGIERSTFVINEEGVLIDEMRGVKAKGHVEALLKKLGL